MTGSSPLHWPEKSIICKIHALKDIGDVNFPFSKSTRINEEVARHRFRSSCSDHRHTANAGIAKPEN